jgi:UDP-N-acetylglucosamine 1-carboxyvinyltransferase
MAKFVIQGGKSLNGEIAVGGAKNAAMKMMAAALLTDKEVILENVPDIQDIHTLQSILMKLGARIKFADHLMSIKSDAVNSTAPDYQLVKHMRGSVVILGPLLARFKQASLPQPGGCLIGARPIDTHIKGFEQLGVTVTQDKDYYRFEAAALRGSNVVLEEMSVTATENILMAAVLAPGETQIHLAASEPEIADLAALLQTMGAKIKGAGTPVISVQGVKKLHGASHRVLPDRIEAGTFAIAAAVSRGNVVVKNFIPEHQAIVLNKLKEANVNFDFPEKSVLHIKPTTIFKPINFETRPYPGFPTDLQAPMSVLLTQANGTSRIFETMYEGRLGYVKELAKMGADATITDAHTVVINGPTPLYGKEITSFDIRAGATLIIAALIAQGESVIDRIEFVDRGYEKIEDRLNSIGAKIKRVI